MKRFFSRNSQYIVLLLTFLAQPLWSENDRAPFWSFKSDQATVYLLGSIHFANHSFYPLREAIEQAFDHSDYLVVEADILNSDQLAVQGFILKQGIYSGDETLRDHISEKTWQELLNYARELSLPTPEQILAKQKPAMVVMTLSSLMLMDQGLNPDMGIDIHFLRQALESGKPVLELEGVQQQLDLLFNLDMPDVLLQKSLEEVDGADDVVNQMISAWKRGDAEDLNKLLIEGPMADTPEFEQLMEKLDFARNREMVKKLNDYIQQGGTYFVVVGAAHLVGDQGIPALMSQHGIIFTQQ